MSFKNFFRYIQSFISGYTIERTSSPYNPELQVCYVNGRKFLNAKSVNYSYGGCYDATNKIFREICLKERSIESTLILGLGVGGAVDLLRNTYQKECRITGVEIDEKVLELGRKYFDTDKFNDLKIVCADAIAYMQENREFFDLIFVDIFIDYVVPEECQQEDFLKHLKRSISSNGMLIFNKLEIKDQEKSTLEILKKSFNTVMPGHAIHQLYKNEPNYMFVYVKSD